MLNRGEQSEAKVSDPQYNKGDEKEGVEDSGDPRVTLRMGEQLRLSVGHSTTI